MKFENFFKDIKFNDEPKIIGFLQKNCYDGHCDSSDKCNDCVCCILNDVTLSDLHQQIIDVLLDNELTDEISIDKKVIETAIQNTINSVQILKENYQGAKDSAILETSDEFINCIRKNLSQIMDKDVSFETVLSLINNDKLTD